MDIYWKSDYRILHKVYKFKKFNILRLYVIVWHAAVAKKKKNQIFQIFLLRFNVLLVA